MRIRADFGLHVLPVLCVLLAVDPTSLTCEVTADERAYDFELVNGGAVIFREGPRTMFPCVVRLPDWLTPEQRANPQASYYFYYCQHHGQYIFMSWAERITGPWREFNVGEQDNEPLRRGVFDIEADSLRSDYGHLAAPDVHIDDVNRRFIMFFHAKTQPQSTTASGRIVPQVHQGFVATSADGLNFNDPETGGGQPGHGPKTVTVEGVTRDIWMGAAYQRGFRHQGTWYSIAKRGVIDTPPSPADPWQANPDDPFAMAWMREDTPSALWRDNASSIQPHDFSPAAAFLASSEFESHPNNPCPGVRIDCQVERMNHPSVFRLPNDRLEIFFWVRGDPDDRFDSIYRILYDIGNPDFREWTVARDAAGRVVFDVAVTPEEIEAAVRDAHPDVKPMVHADPVSLGSTYVFEDTDGSKYLFYAYLSEKFGGHDGEGQISAIRLIARERVQR